MKCKICGKEIEHGNNYHPRCAGKHQGGIVKAIRDKKQMKF